MGIGIKDYIYENIIFVHDFIYIYLILVFWMIIAYFVIIYMEYIPIKKKNYWKLYVQIKKSKKNKVYSTRMSYFYNIFLQKGMLNFIHKFARTLRYYLNKTHNLVLEVLWTFIPIGIISELIFPSLSLIADDTITDQSSLYTINVIGNQWYWNYELNTKQGIIKQVSNLILVEESKIKKEKKYTRLLATTNSVSIPVGLKTSFFISSNDVAHSWAIPAIGLKVDAIPGRINLKTVLASKMGLYSGMCSELCGIEHGFMPISLEVLTINNWIYNLEYFNEKSLNYSFLIMNWLKKV